VIWGGLYRLYLMINHAQRAIGVSAISSTLWFRLLSRITTFFRSCLDILSRQRSGFSRAGAVRNDRSSWSQFGCIYERRPTRIIALARRKPLDLDCSAPCNFMACSEFAGTHCIRRVVDKSIRRREETASVADHVTVHWLSIILAFIASFHHHHKGSKRCPIPVHILQFLETRYDTPGRGS
jgi:hypothetical protein